jgi:hypothetical protein
MSENKEGKKLNWPIEVKFPECPMCGHFYVPIQQGTSTEPRLSCKCDPGVLACIYGNYSNCFSAFAGPRLKVLFREAGNYPHKFSNDMKNRFIANGLEQHLAKKDVWLCTDISMWSVEFIWDLMDRGRRSLDVSRVSRSRL